MSTAKPAKACSPEDELVCPITQELVFDPVMAEDGTLYEKTAIEEYLSTKSGSGMVKSPYKGIMMGRKLIPAPQIKAMIEKMIDNGSIAGDLTDEWKRHMLDNCSTLLMKRAERGDVKAMEDIGDAFNQGDFGFEWSDKEALKWYQKARRAGSVKGMVKAGIILLGGDSSDDVPWDRKEWDAEERLGFMYIHEAAQKGSDLAAYCIGLSVKDHDPEEANRWFKKALDDKSCVHRLMSAGQRNTATFYTKEA